MSKTIDARIKDAYGLEPWDAATVAQLYAVWDKNRKRNRTRMLYYCDEQDFYNLGLSVPREFAAELKTPVGWCAKAVDMLGNRSILDGITAQDEAGETLARIIEENALAAAYDLAKPSELIHGCGFWVPMRDEDMNCGVSINYYDAEEASALWDYRRKRVAAGMVVGDYTHDKYGGISPSLLYVYTDTAIITLAVDAIGEWHASYEYHPMGRAPFVSMCYRPSKSKPFGRSRISKTCMGITDSVRRELLRMELHSECYSQPQRYILGIDEADARKSKFNLYMDSLLLAGRDENGDIPTVGQFAQASMTPHIEVLDKLADRMSSETCIPASAFGVAHSTYVSNESLRASSDDLILECESLNDTNGRALRTVAQMALAVAGNKAFKDLDAQELAVSVRFVNPCMPSIASATDAMTKQAAISSWLPETKLYWERLGYSEQERAELFAEKQAAEASAALNAFLFGGESE